MISEVGIVAALLSMLVAIVGDVAERKPGNLTPIQLISAIGAWALVLANASAMAIRDGSPILFSTAAATFVVALVSFVRDCGGCFGPGRTRAGEAGRR